MSATSRDSVPDRTAWEAERRALRERAAELDAQLSSRRREHLRVALERPAPYLTEALGALPDQPRARRTWQQAATRIEAYRFDHAITDTRHALGPRPGRHASSVRTGNAPTTTCNAPSATSVGASTADPRTSSDSDADVICRRDSRRGRTPSLRHGSSLPALI